MDGSAWEVKLRADTLFASSSRETLLFEKGRFTAAAHAGSGFSASEYSAQSFDGDVDMIWNASLPHAERGVMTWHGLVRGDEIEGIAVLWRKDAKPKRFTFHGTRKSV